MLVFLHIIGDSVLQSQKLRQQKIEKIIYLFKHVGIYTLVFLFFCPIVLNLNIIQTLWFCCVTALLHFIEDFIFIKIKSHYWKTNDYKFVATFSILEHILHIVFLIATFIILFPGSISVNNWYQDFIMRVYGN